MIDILIPTFNRSEFLIKNLFHIEDLIQKENLVEKFRVIVSDNCSTDDTYQQVIESKEKLSFEVQLYQQKENIGLESNAVFVLQKATAEYIVYLGDDDYFPDGYLTKLQKIVENSEFGVVFPGFSSLSLDGKVGTGRKDIIPRTHEAGDEAVYDLSILAHQLSGLFLKEREL